MCISANLIGLTFKYLPQSLASSPPPLCQPGPSHYSLSTELMQESPSKSPFSFFTLTVYSPHSSQWSLKKQKKKDHVLHISFKGFVQSLSKIQSPYHHLAPNYLSDLTSSISLSFPTVSFFFFKLMEYTIHIPNSGVLHQLLLPCGRLDLRHSPSSLPSVGPQCYISRSLLWPFNLKLHLLHHSPVPDSVLFSSESVLLPGNVCLLDYWFVACLPH